MHKVNVQSCAMNFIHRTPTIRVVHDLRQRQVDWVDAILTARGWSLTELASAAGIAASTLTRWRNSTGNATGGETLSTATVAKIESAAGIRSYEMPTADGRSFAESEAEPYDPGKGDNPVDAMLAAIAGGRPGVDAWRLTSRSLDIRGYLPDDIVAVDLNEKPESGDIVCAQVYDWKRARAETVFRIYEAPVLVAASTDVRASRPYVIDEQTVVVKGVVIGLVRLPERRAPRASRRFRVVT
jgi:transcriptional regulator with XRE-family HTH domain